MGSPAAIPFRSICKTAIPALLALALTACSDGSGNGTFSFLNPADEVAITAPNTVDERLANAAGEASQALATLAAIEQARTPNADVAPVVGAPAELQRAVTVQWNGPIAPLTERLAQRAGYQFRILGVEPAVPVVVNIDARQMPVIEVLRDLGLQAGTRADIAVDAQTRVVEVRYRERENEPLSLMP